jgi:hypothetical protein
MYFRGMVFILFSRKFGLNSHTHSYAHTARDGFQKPAFFLPKTGKQTTDAADEKAMYLYG